MLIVVNRNSYFFVLSVVFVKWLLPYEDNIYRENLYHFLTFMFSGAAWQLYV